MSLRTDAALRSAGALAALVGCVFLPVWALGLSPFWGDLTYIHFPWKSLDVQYIQAGRLPLWNPYLYLGMPMSAGMQDAAFYPGSLPYFFFGFAGATAVFHAWHYWLAATLSYLWLRAGRLAHASALAGGVLVSLGGVFLSHMPFLNHIAVLSLAPGLLLFFRRPWLLALTLACAFFAGYPPFLIGAAAIAWALRLVFDGRPAREFWRESLAGWAAAGLLGMALSACLLLPAAELFSQSRRASGIELSEALAFGFAPKDLLQWISPLLVGWKAFNPAVEWWKGCYAGFVGWLAIATGFLSLSRRKASGLAAIMGGLLLLILGQSNALSAAAWAHFTPLKFIRYPGNLAYMALPCLALLAAAGFERLPRRGLVLALLIVEMMAYGLKPFPAAPRRLFIDPGPLVRTLQDGLNADRYLLSPLALERQSGMGIADWKYRLYGLTNAPFRLRSAGNFGEPLVPRDSYAFMDALYRRPGAESAAALFPWADIAVLLTPGPAAPSKLLRPQGRRLWDISRYTGALGGAYWFDSRQGDKIPDLVPEPGREQKVGQPLALERSREDRFRIRGNFAAPGWVYVCEPRYPGWKTTLEALGTSSAVQSFPAMTAFQKIPVPAGLWELRFRYEPWSWEAGRLLTGLSLLVFAGYWYNRALGKTG